jgi:hypothetical protein
VESGAEENSTPNAEVISGMIVSEGEEVVPSPSPDGELGVEETSKYSEALNAADEGREKLY